MLKLSYILSPIVLLTFLFPSFAFGVDWDDLVFREGLWYKKFSDVPFTGTVDETSKGRGQTHGKIKKGKQVGPWIYYCVNGQLGYKATFKDGKKISD